MVWWLFKKKTENISEHPHIKKIESALKNSFNNIKNDVSQITSHVKTHKGHIEKIHERLDKLEMNILHLHDKLDVNSETEIEEKEEIPTIDEEKIIDNLTTVQTSILSRLAHLQTESNEKWIATKTLTEDLYPDKEYSKIRPMMSDYLNILLDFGLINKIRKRRQTFVSLTKKALNLTPKNKQKKLIQILNKN